MQLVGFTAESLTGGARGDSGAVVTIRRDQTFSRTDDSGQIDVTGTDVDGPREYAPGAVPDMDRFLGGDGSGITVSGTTLDDQAGKALLARISARLLRLGELEVVVSASGFKNPCREVGRRSRRPTACREIILRPGREVEEPLNDPDEIEEIESETTCCTFGRRPFVTVSGDDSETLEFDLLVTGAASLHIKYSVEQTVMSARFFRHGACCRTICDREVLRREVVLSRKAVFEVSGSLGEIELPIICKINAGQGGFKREAVKTVRKKFVLPCSAG